MLRAPPPYGRPIFGFALFGFALFGFALFGFALCAKHRGKAQRLADALAYASGTLPKTPDEPVKPPCSPCPRALSISENAIKKCFPVYGEKQRLPEGEPGERPQLLLRSDIFVNISIL